MHIVSRRGWGSDRLYLAVAAVATILVIIAVVAALSRDVQAAGSKVVTRSDMQGWSMHGATGDFVLDPSSPSGAGVLRYSTPEVSSRVYISMPVLGLKYTRDLDASYATKRLAGSVYAAPGFSFQIDTDGDMSTTGDRFSAMYEPRYNNPGNTKNYSEWNVWDINQDSLFWYNGAKPSTVTTHTAPLRQALMGNENTARLISVRINQGTSNTGWLTLVDSVRLFDTTYDFEPILGPVLNVPVDQAVISTATSQVQSWTAINGATMYAYESYNEDPIVYPSITPVINQSVSETSRVINSSASEGTYFWRVRAIAPFVSEWSELRSFTIDNTAPSITITSPTAFVEGEDVVVAGTATDNYSAVDKVGVYVDGIEEGTAMVVNGGFSYNLGQLAPGAYEIIAKGADAAGNVGMSDPVTITIAAKPVVTPPVAPPIVDTETPQPTPAEPTPGAPTPAPSIQPRVAWPYTAAAMVPYELSDVSDEDEGDLFASATSDNDIDGGRTVVSQEVRGLTDDKAASAALSPLGLAWHYWAVAVVALVVITLWLFLAARRRRIDIK